LVRHHWCRLHLCSSDSVIDTRADRWQDLSNTHGMRLLAAGHGALLLLA
jgi:hypothetical protein